MRVVGLDMDASWHVLEACDVYYDPSEGELSVVTTNGETYTVGGIDKRNAEAIVKQLYTDGAAQIPSNFRLE